jgi:hypothetical protein
LREVLLAWMRMRMPSSTRTPELDVPSRSAHHWSPADAERETMTQLVGSWLVGAMVMLLVAASGAVASTAASGEPRAVALTFDAIPADRAFPDAAEAGALRWACAATAEVLRLGFEQRGAPFDAALVHERDDRSCHIDYEPSVPGYRADPDDLRVSELFINVDSLALVAQRREVFGDSLDISARIVADMPRDVPIVLSTERDLARHWFGSGAVYRYEDRASLVSWRTTQTNTLVNPWTQDFLKSGMTGTRRTILVPRNLYEGRAADGAAFAPFLDSLDGDPRFARSKLSWEGGDLQFVRHPRQSSQVILLFGQSARAYWGQDLTPEEYVYVLQREFGADLSIEVSGITPHVDFFVSFLPAEGIALVSEPVTGNRALALAAVDLLREHFTQDTPQSIDALADELARPDALPDRRRQVRRLLATVRKEAEAGWPGAGVVDLYNRMQTYVHQHCPLDAAACLSDAGIDTMLQRDPDLLRDWLAESRRTRSDALFITRLLDIIESQVEDVDRRVRERMDAKVRELEQVGFTIVRVPRFGSDHNGSTKWAGVSYVNSLLVDDHLFVPTFGLGEVEAAMLEAIDAAVPERYRVVPTYARHMLLFNGGVHCAVAIVRESSPHEGVPAPLDTDER